MPYQSASTSHVSRLLLRVSCCSCVWATNFRRVRATNIFKPSWPLSTLPMMSCTSRIHHCCVKAVSDFFAYELDLPFLNRSRLQHRRCHIWTGSMYKTPSTVLCTSHLHNCNVWATSAVVSNIVVYVPPKIVLRRAVSENFPYKWCATLLCIILKIAHPVDDWECNGGGRCNWDGGFVSSNWSSAAGGGTTTSASVVLVGGSKDWQAVTNLAIGCGIVEGNVAGRMRLEDCRGGFGLDEMHK